MLTLITAALLIAQQPTAKSLLEKRGFAWQSEGAAQFTVHIDSSATAARAQLLHFRLDQAHARARRLLGMPVDTARIHVFFVGSVARMRKLTGRSTNGIAHHRTRVVALVITPEWGASAAHEIFHIIAMRHWGLGPVWLNEGMAVYADDQWRGARLHDAARKLAEARQLVALPQLQRKFRDVDEKIAYPQAGSFAKYLYEKHGRAVVQALWRENDVELKKLTGKDLVQLEQEWRAFLVPENRPDNGLGIFFHDEDACVLDCFQLEVSQALTQDVDLLRR